MKHKKENLRISLGENPSEFLKQYTYDDSIGDFSIFWQKYQAAISGDRETAPSKVASFGAFRLAGWVASFAILAGLGWFGFQKLLVVTDRLNLENSRAMVVSMVSGNTEVKKSGASTWRVLRVEDHISAGDSVRTGNDGQCELQTLRRGVYRLENASAMVLSKLSAEKSGHSTRIRLTGGSIALKPNKLAHGDSFEVATLSGTASVKGTKFLVRAEPDGGTRVSVLEGEVSFKPVLPSISEARQQGKIDSSAVKILEDALAAPVLIDAGEEGGIAAADLRKMDVAASKSIAAILPKSGILTVSALTNSENTNQPLLAAVQENLRRELTVTNGSATNQPEDPLALVKKKEMSLDARQKLDQLTESIVMGKLSDSVRVKFVSVPEGANVYIDGAAAGKSPSEPLLGVGRKFNVRFSRPGFADVVRELVASNGLSVQAWVTNPAATDVSPSNGGTGLVGEILNLKPGGIAWKKQLKLSPPEKEILIYRGRIFVSINNRLLVLTTAGEVLKNFKVAPEGQVLTRAVAAGGQVLVGSDGGGLYAFSPEGALLWTSPQAGAEKYNASPAYDGGVIAVPTLDKGVQLFGRDGVLTETIAVNAPLYATPLLLQGGKILIYGTENGEVTARDIAAKKVLWSKSPVSKVLYPLVGNGELALAVDRSAGTVVALRVNDGSTAWKQELPEIVKTRINPILSENRLVLAASSPKSSKITVIAADTGAVVFHAEFPEAVTHPYLFDGKVYVGSASGKVYSYLMTGGAAWASGLDMQGATVIADKDGVYALTESGFAKLAK